MCCHPEGRLVGDHILKSMDCLITAWYGNDEEDEFCLSGAGRIHFFSVKMSNT